MRVEFGEPEGFRMAAGELAGVHLLRPGRADLEPYLGEGPEGFLGPFVAGTVAIKEDRYLMTGERLC